MQVHKSFLISTLILLMSFSEQGWTMQDDQINSHSTSKVGKITGNLPALPVEIQEHIFSFLDQRDLLRAGGSCKSWRKATERVWKKNLWTYPKGA